MSKKLILCPFCKSQHAELRKQYNKTELSMYTQKYYMYCPRCRARGPVSSVDTEALNNWNAANDTAQEIYNKFIAALMKANYEDDPTLSTGDSDLILIETSWMDKPELFIAIEKEFEL